MLLSLVGSRADMASRQDVPPSRMSRLSTSSAQARLEIDEVNMKVFMGTWMIDNQ